MAAGSANTQLLPQAALVGQNANTAGTRLWLAILPATSAPPDDNGEQLQTARTRSGTREREHSQPSLLAQAPS